MFVGLRNSRKSVAWSQLYSKVKEFQPYTGANYLAELHRNLSKITLCSRKRLINIERRNLGKINVLEQTFPQHLCESRRVQNQQPYFSQYSMNQLTFGKIGGPIFIFKVLLILRPPVFFPPLLIDFIDYENDGPLLYSVVSCILPNQKRKLS